MSFVPPTVEPVPRGSRDLLASLVCFLVALPLCMGISIASGVPPSAGILTGIIGGIVVGSLAGCPLQVSGPAAGLSVIVFDMVQRFGFETLGLIVLLAGCIQMVAGILGLGRWFRAVPPAVVHGMLAGIGCLIFSSQFHVMLDDSPKGSGIANILSIPRAIYDGIFPLDGSPHEVAALTGIVTILGIMLWSAWKPDRLALLPAPLVGVCLGSTFARFLELPVRYVDVPGSLLSAVRLPSRELLDSQSIGALLTAAIVLALVASAETLLTAVAVDSIQSRSPRTNYNRELVSQGVGNILCGLVGGLPLTGVIVRSKANVDAGAVSRLSAILHGFWLLAFLLLVPGLLRLIPVSALAAVLVHTGIKLFDVARLRHIAFHGRMEAFIHVATVVGIVTVDLLTGVLLGLALATVKLLHVFCRVAVDVEKEGSSGSGLHLHLRGFATFLVLPRLALVLDTMPERAQVRLSASQLDYLDYSCLELLRDWAKQHRAKGGEVHADWTELESIYRRGPGAG